MSINPYTNTIREIRDYVYESFYPEVEDDFEDSSAEEVSEDSNTDEACDFYSPTLTEFEIRQNKFSETVQDFAEKLNTELSTILQAKETKTQLEKYTQSQSLQEILGRTITHNKLELYKLTKEQRLEQILKTLDKIFSLKEDCGLDLTIEDDKPLNSELVQIVRTIVSEPILELYRENFSVAKPSCINEGFLLELGSIASLNIENQLETTWSRLTKSQTLFTEPTEKEIESIQYLDRLVFLLYYLAKDRPLPNYTNQLLAKILKQNSTCLERNNNIDNSNDDPLLSFSLELIKLLSQAKFLKLDQETQEQIFQLFTTNKSLELDLAKILSKLKIDKNNKPQPELIEPFIKSIFQIDSHPALKLFVSRLLVNNPILAQPKLITKLVGALTEPQNSAYVKTVLNTWSQNSKLKADITSSLFHRITLYFKQAPETRKSKHLYELLSVLSLTLDSSKKLIEKFIHFNRACENNEAALFLFTILGFNDHEKEINKLKNQNSISFFKNYFSGLGRIPISAKTDYERYGITLQCRSLAKQLDLNTYLFTQDSDDILLEYFFKSKKPLIPNLSYKHDTVENWLMLLDLTTKKIEDLDTSIEKIIHDVENKLKEEPASKQKIYKKVNQNSSLIVLKKLEVGERNSSIQILFDLHKKAYETAKNLRETENIDFQRIDSCLQNNLERLGTAIKTQLQSRHNFIKGDSSFDAEILLAQNRITKSALDNLDTTPDLDFNLPPQAQAYKSSSLSA